MCIKAFKALTKLKKQHGKIIYFLAKTGKVEQLP
jgi:hypothetical protein